MAKIKLTKNEYKKQKDSLKMFTRYLPTLMLKKQQLQMEIRKVEARDREVREKRESLNRDFLSWIAVFGEDTGLDASLLTVEFIKTRKGNIAGVVIPVFEGASFRLAEYDLFVKPLWVDKAAEKLKTIMLLDLESKVLQEQVRLLGMEWTGLFGTLIRYWRSRFRIFCRRMMAISVVRFSRTTQILPLQA